MKASTRLALIALAMTSLAAPAFAGPAIPKLAPVQVTPPPPIRLGDAKVREQRLAAVNRARAGASLPPLADYGRLTQLGGPVTIALAAPTAGGGAIEYFGSDWARASITESEAYVSLPSNKWSYVDLEVPVVGGKLYMADCEVAVSTLGGSGQALFSISSAGGPVTTTPLDRSGHVYYAFSTRASGRQKLRIVYDDGFGAWSFRSCTIQPAS